MLLPTIKRSLNIISLSVAVGLMGCQSAPLNSTQQTTIVNAPVIKDKSNFTDQIVIKESQVMQ